MADVPLIFIDASDVKHMKYQLEDKILQMQISKRKPTTASEDKLTLLKRIVELERSSPVELGNAKFYFMIPEFNSEVKIIKKILEDYNIEYNTAYR
jgi:hypothetical protein